MLLRIDRAGTALVVTSTESSITLAAVAGRDAWHEVCLPITSDEIARLIAGLRRPQSPHEGLVASMDDERGRRITLFRDLPDGVAVTISGCTVWLHRDDYDVVADVAAYLEQTVGAAEAVSR